MEGRMCELAVWNADMCELCVIFYNGMMGVGQS